MPNEAFDPILDRDTARVIAEPVTDIASPVLKEAVNWATDLYPKYQTSKVGEKPEALFQVEFSSPPQNISGFWTQV